MSRRLQILGSILGGLAVLLGAFGAHGLEKLVDAEAIETFKTGVTYQMYHAFFLFVVSLFSVSDTLKGCIFWCVLIGIILFSGSIYLLALNAITSFDFATIALLTPLGGTLLIISWTLLIISLLKNKAS